MRACADGGTEESLSNCRYLRLIARQDGREPGHLAQLPTRNLCDLRAQLFELGRVQQIWTDSVAVMVVRVHAALRLLEELLQPSGNGAEDAECRRTNWSPEDAAREEDGSAHAPEKGKSPTDNRCPIVAYSFMRYRYWVRAAPPWAFTLLRDSSVDYLKMARTLCMLRREDQEGDDVDHKAHDQAPRSGVGAIQSCQMRRARRALPISHAGGRPKGGGRGRH